MSKPAIAVDLDGVLHSHTSKFTVPWKVLDPPVPNSFAWLERMSQDFDIIIHTSRFTKDQGAIERTRVLTAVVDWLERYELDADVLRSLTFWTHPGKPHALLYVDDRAYRFEGRFPTRADVFKKPWKMPLR
jgi:hypothetical protein